MLCQQRQASIIFATVTDSVWDRHRYGSVAAGAVGSAKRQTYTLYGDTVNLAQRLEELNKELDTDCLIWGTTFKAAESSCVGVVALGPMQVRGREPAEVFALGR